MSLGEILLERGKITAEHLQAALAARKGPEDRVDRILVRLGYVDERDVLEVLGEQLAIPVIDLSEVVIDRDLLKRTPSKLVHRRGLLPISREGDAVRVATSDPFDVYSHDELAMVLGCKIEPVLAPFAEIDRVIKQNFGIGGQTVDEMIGDDDVEVLSDSVDDASDLIELAQEATVVKLVNEILLEAINERASDVHIEPYDNDLRIRYRIDGVLQTTNVPPQIRKFQAAIISRLKILSNLNIAEKRLPQDGGFSIKAKGREIDLRISIVPTAFGEGVVIRILDKQSVVLSLPKLGMNEETMGVFESLITRPHGIILVTGPTGSGKTTTLYTALNLIVSDKIKILTVEDPIEYYLEGVNQVQISPKIGLTFAAGLRSFLRHDPDVILVGEIRDRETAETAINASLTGHLVFSTLHTNDAPTAFTRLIDMGVEPFLVSSSLEGVLAQRLVRRICNECKEPYQPDRDKLPSDVDLAPGEPLYRGIGCRACRQSGYAGRFGIYELLMVSEDIREMIVRRESSTAIRDVAMKNGMKMLRRDGWDKVKAGLTTPEEVMRVAKAG